MERKRKIDKVRASRDGHEFHEAWTARKAMQLLWPDTDLTAIAVEGLSPTDKVCASDQFNRLEEELGHQRASRDLLKKRVELVHKIELSGAEIKVKKATNHKKLVSDFDERKERLDDAVVLFEELSRGLSERSAVLVIEPTEKELELDIQNAPIRSTGIREQQIFCFDMLLTVMQQKRVSGLDFLVHDSHLFDAMEERQIASALEVAVKLSKEHDFQYIVTLNSDKVPNNEFSDGFDFGEYVLPQCLSDKTEDGGLFGFRFV